MISSQRLGERIADARKRAGLTQAELAGRLGLARTTVVAVEKGERRPSSNELVSLAEALSVSVHDLLREPRVRPAVSPRFRISAGADDRSQAVRDVVQRLEQLGSRYAELEKMHGIERQPARLESIQTYVVSEAGTGRIDPQVMGESAAVTVRGLLGLGHEPVGALDEMLEAEAGLRIFHLDRIPAEVAAVFVWGDEIGACVGVNAAHPLEKRRWSVVHEGGHFLRDREAGDVLFRMPPRSKDPAEVFAEAFAKNLLMPAQGVSRWFADRCRASGDRFTPLDIVALAQFYGVSFQAVTLRLEELRLLPSGTYDKLARRRIHRRDVEKIAGIQPAAPKRPRMLPERYVALAVSAYDQEKLSEGELAEFLMTDRVSAREEYERHRRVEIDEERRLELPLGNEDLRAC